MKTFKLKALTILAHKKDSIVYEPIELLDGLVIDREDDKNYWLIEAYLEKQYYAYFESLKTKHEIIVKVKISKEANDPAYFIANITQINDVHENFNVLLTGRLIKQQQTDLSKRLNDLTIKGYQGQQLINQLKNLNE